MPGDRERGQALRAAREGAGLTLAQVAAHAQYTVAHLSNMERGQRTIRPDVPWAYERAIRETDVRRRGLLSGLAASAIAPAAVGELIRSGFNAALADKRADVDEWDDKLDGLGRDYMTRGAPEVQRTLTGDLVVLQQQLDTPRMWGTASKALAIYGKTTAGPQEAIGWYRLAAVAAERSDDVEARVWVAGRAALALGYEGAATPTAARFADEALELSDRPSPGRLNALMGKVHVQALRGQADEARRTWEDVQRLYDILSPDDTVSDFNYPYWRLAVVGSLLHARLGDDTAERWQSDVDRYRPADMARFETHVELHRGLMMAMAGDKAGGIAYAQAALDRLPAEKVSQSLVLMLDEIRRVPE